MQKHSFFGTATIGSKGQVVIPIEAREQLGIKSGDKMVVIGVNDRNMIALCPLESIESMLTELTEKLKTIKTITNSGKD